MMPEYTFSRSGANVAYTSSSWSWVTSSFSTHSSHSTTSSSSAITGTDALPLRADALPLSVDAAPLRGPSSSTDSAARTEPFLRRPPREVGLIKLGLLVSSNGS